MTRKRPAPLQNRPSPNETDVTEYIAGLRRRGVATSRVVRLDCGCRDPWPCRCDDDAEPNDHYVDGWRDAALHLLERGLLPAPNLPAKRVMWGRRGSDQRLARQISERWAA